MTGRLKAPVFEAADSRPSDFGMAKPASAKRTHAKTILRLPDLDVAKAAVINSLSCPDAQRGYRHAIEEFIDGYCSELRLSFSKIVVVRYRMHLESRHLAPGTINLRLGAVRRFADCQRAARNLFRQARATTPHRRFHPGPEVINSLAMSSGRGLSRLRCRSTLECPSPFACRVSVPCRLRIGRQFEPVCVDLAGCAVHLKNHDDQPRGLHDFVALGKTESKSGLTMASNGAKDGQTASGCGG